MKWKYDYPHRVATDQGETDVKIVPARKAMKQHLCPICHTLTQFAEKHVLLLPIRHPGNRRYLHIKCYEDIRDKNTFINLHPNNSAFSEHYGSE